MMTVEEAVAARYSKEQGKIILGLYRSNADRTKQGLSISHLFPQWFLGEKALSGFARCRAPELNAEEIARLKALYEYGKRGNESKHGWALVLAGALLWLKVCPEEMGPRLYDPEAFDFDPANIDAWAEKAFSSPATPARSAMSHLSMADCMRIAHNQL